MMDRAERIILNDLERRAQSVRGGAGAALRSTPMGIMAGNLMNTVQLAKVKSNVGGALYRMYPIDKDGTAIGGTTSVLSSNSTDSYFYAYEADGVTTVANGTRVMAFQIGGEGKYAFFRPVGNTRFDGVCRIDEFAPGVVDPNQWDAMVENTVGGNGGITPDAGTMEYLLMHLATPLPNAPGRPVFILFSYTRVFWDLNVNMWGDLRYNYFIDWITQDFDFANDGSVVPPRNTWATRPTIVAGAGFRAEINVIDCLEAIYEPRAAVFTQNLLTPALPMIYGVQIRPVNWVETGGAIFDDTRTDFGVGAGGAGSYILGN